MTPSPLMRAVKLADAALVERLLDEGADPNEEGFGCHLLEASIETRGSGCDLPWDAWEKQSDQIILALLNHGADPNVGAGRSPLLSRAIHLGRHGAVKALLSAGADPDHGNMLGRSAVFAAAEEKNEAALELLARHGAKLDQADIYGERVVEWMAKWTPDEDFAEQIEHWIAWQAMHQAALPAQAIGPKKRL